MFDDNQHHANATMIPIHLNNDDDDDSDFLPMLSLEENDESDNNTPDINRILPILPLKNMILFPGVVAPITVGREISIRAINYAAENGKHVAVLSQKDSNQDGISADSLFAIGTVARIVKVLKMPDGSTTVIMQGRRRCELKEIITDKPFMQGEFDLLMYDEITNEREFEALISSVRDKARKIIDLSPNIPNEANMMLQNVKSDTFLLNFICSNINLKNNTKQQLLEMDSLSEKAHLILQHMDSELQLLELKGEIEQKVRTEMDKQQRDYYLNQQLKTIQDELAGGKAEISDIDALKERAKDMKWSPEVNERFEKELQKLKRIQQQSPDYSLQISYLETLLELPWGTYTEDNFDLKKVQKILDDDHFGLEDVKDRIVEHLAVLKLKGDMKAPILLLVGPPGVGKTSLGKSIATALGRKFVRMSLGGITDEAEIRGHRKTYIGALAGRIIQGLKKVGSSNPVFLLDEIDKIGTTHRGDPAAALLEVLDPEQNSTFQDNYLEVEYDLSKVLFIATANYMYDIHEALRDRMEVIRIAGYSVEEKVEIAKQHLIPEQKKEHGLKPKEVTFDNDAVTKMIEGYTYEAGVRGLNQKIAKSMRFVAKQIGLGEDYPKKIKIEHLEKILGKPRSTKERFETDQIAGVVVGLAWTSVGGEILFIETTLSKGKGGLILTGNLGNVMRESASTALSFLKTHAEKLNIDPKVFEAYDIHIHVPEGATPKDGPSAGITMLTTLASAFKGQPVKSHLAMTGEITLRGKVLPVGGIKEKILAAKRAGIKTIIMCAENEKDVLEVNQSYLKGLTFHYVKRMTDVLELAFDKIEKPKAEKGKKKAKKETVETALMPSNLTQEPAQ